MRMLDPTMNRFPVFQDSEISETNSYPADRCCASALPELLQPCSYLTRPLVNFLRREMAITIGCRH